MSEETTSSVPGGNAAQGGAESHDQDTVVPRNTYVKVIDEVKSVKKRLAESEAKRIEHESALKAIEEQKMLDEKKHLELIEMQKKKIADLENQNNVHVQDKNDFRKLNGLLSVMQQKGIQLESQYYGLLPLDKIGFDEEGNIDNASLAKAAEDFQKAHPRLTIPLAKLLPNNASGSGSGPKMSIEQWKKLDPKERRKALAEDRVEKPKPR